MYICGLCKHLQDEKTFTCTNNKTFTVSASMSCDVNNIIYVITGSGCNLNYMGETNNLRHRTTVHNQQIREINTRKFPCMCVCMCMCSLFVLPYLVL